jgi:hypothetical protein
MRAIPVFSSRRQLLAAMALAGFAPWLPVAQRRSPCPP